MRNQRLARAVPTTRLRRTRRQARVYSAYANAARDPAFLDEMQTLDVSFDITLGDD